MTQGDPFFITGPAVINVSGGRSSADLLRRIVEAHGGRLPRDVVAVFCNTGKEAEASLRFVNECDRRYGVGIIWLEYDATLEQRTSIVDFKTARRDGEPFAELIATKTMLPNRMSAYCTIELKIRRVREFCVGVLGWDRWTSVVGFRADEQKRVAKLPARNAARKDRWITVAPLAEAGITNSDILAFWGPNDFDLDLPVNEWGDTEGGNCVHCHKKGLAKAMRCARADPGSLDWWIGQEGTGRGQGRADFFRQSYDMAELKRAALAGEQPRKVPKPLPLFADEDEEEMDCACTD